MSLEIRIFSLLLLLTALPLWPQEKLVGMKLADLIERFGAPRVVLAARGNETWQDDVVFQYAEGDFYICKDRVWQVKVASIRGISLGDPKQAAALVMGNAAEDRGDHLLMPVIGAGLPLMLRVNINSAGAVSSIFIYRPDF
jgi:hypothetical protein